MQTINRYIFKNILFTFSMAVGIATFMGLVAISAKGFTYMADGVNLKAIFMFILYSMPKILIYTFPMAALISTVLVFNRMSADNEISALRASGISILQIMTPVMSLAIILSLLCAWLQFQLNPKWSFLGYWEVKKEALENPMDFIQEGTDIEMFEGFHLLIDKIDGDTLDNVQIFVMDQKSGKLSQRIIADKGTIEVDTTKQEMHLELFNATQLSFNPENPLRSEDVKITRMGSYKTTLDYGAQFSSRELISKNKQMTFKQLMGRIQILESLGHETISLHVEIHKRAAWSLAPFTLVLVGIPLGLQLARRENAFGLIAAVGVTFAYFGMMILIESFKRNAAVHPQFLMWIPNIFLQCAGIVMLWKKR